MPILKACSRMWPGREPSTSLGRRARRMNVSFLGTPASWLFSGSMFYSACAFYHVYGWNLPKKDIFQNLENQPRRQTPGNWCQLSLLCPLWGSAGGHKAEANILVWCKEPTKPSNEIENWVKFFLSKRLPTDPSFSPCPHLSWDLLLLFSFIRRLISP